MSTKYFTSDLHFGHKKVAGLRGYDDVLKHDIAIRDTLKETLKPEDELFILGDLVGRADAWHWALLLVRSIPLRAVHLIAGNHDPVHPASSKFGDYMQSGLRTFDTIAPFRRVRIAKGEHAMLSHFPYTRERGGADPRWLQWRLRDEGALLLHGHTHEATRVNPGGREIHVGWDAWERPVSLEEIRALAPEARAGAFAPAA